MATNATRTQSTTAATTAMQAALAQEQATRRAQASAPASGEDAARKASGYGLPCAKCHLYYPADLDICPTCRHHERVSPVVPRIAPRVTQAAPDPIPDT